MNYMMLILEPHGQRATRTQAEGEAAYAAMLDYAQTLKSAGKLQAAESLINDDRVAACRCAMAAAAPQTARSPKARK